VLIVCFHICTTTLEVRAGQAMHARKSRRMIWRFCSDFLKPEMVVYLQSNESRIGNMSQGTALVDV